MNDLKRFIGTKVTVDLDELVTEYVEAENYGPVNADLNHDIFHYLKDLEFTLESIEGHKPNKCRPMFKAYLKGIQEPINVCYLFDAKTGVRLDCILRNEGYYEL